ncbi:MAG: cytochrome c peroxidase [Methylovulum sp.]|nr:cytochrome c peroxidase [Methylovulum sp.]
MKKLLLNIAILSVSTLNISNVFATVTQEPHSLNTDLRAIIIMKGLTGDPLKGRVIPDIHSKQAQLGMDLFYSKSLGGDQDSACVTCHHPVLGGGDRLSLSIGVEADNPDLLGFGRSNTGAASNPEGGPPVPRNAPTTFNIVAWDKVLFHDGRVESLDKIAGKNGAGPLGIRTPDSAFGTADPHSGRTLTQAQARFPVTSDAEMKGFNHETFTNRTIRNLLAGRLGGFGKAQNDLPDTNYWLTKFRDAYGRPTATAQELITYNNIAFLIGAYERSQAFANTPWKAYVAGNDAAINKSAKQGALLFFRSKAEGGADCASCHSGDFFTDEDFYNLAMPQIGAGKGNGDGSEDFGRFRETKLESDKYAFRTPTLINVSVTGPWSHAGAYTSLEEVTKHHLNPANAIANYDFNQLRQRDIRNLDKMVVNTQKALNASSFLVKNMDLTNDQVNDLVAFLKTLTDPCVKDRNCLAPWIPTPNTDPNGQQLDAVRRNGSLL